MTVGSCCFIKKKHSFLCPSCGKEFQNPNICENTDYDSGPSILLPLGLIFVFDSLSYVGYVNKTMNLAVVIIGNIVLLSFLIINILRKRTYNELRDLENQQIENSSNNPVCPNCFSEFDMSEDLENGEVLCCSVCRSDFKYAKSYKFEQLVYASEESENISKEPEKEMRHTEEPEKEESDSWNPYLEDIDEVFFIFIIINVFIGALLACIICSQTTLLPIIKLGSIIILMINFGCYLFMLWFLKTAFTAICYSSKHLSDIIKILKNKK